MGTSLLQCVASYSIADKIIIKDTMTKTKYSPIVPRMVKISTANSRVHFEHMSIVDITTKVERNVESGAYVFKGDVLMHTTVSSALL